MRLRTAMILVALAGSVAAAAGIGVRATYGARVTADEPQYLLTAISLAEDANLDISDEIGERRYHPFHEVTLDPQTTPLDDGSQVSPHDPFLPLLLALPMQIGGWVGAKLFLAFLNGALAALLVWIAVRRLRVRPSVAAVVVGLFAASAPLAVYGQQVYPELPAAFAVAVAIAALTGPLRRSGLVTIGVSVVALPWLSVKYVPVAAAIAVAILWKLVRARRRNDALGLAGALGLAALAYVGAHLAWYDGLTVYGTGDHFASTGEFSVVGTDVDLLGRSRRLIGLLVDDKFGLAVWQPAFLLVLPALGAYFRKRPPELGWALLVAAIGWLNATFVALTMQGWWWPGRQTVIVVPVLVLAVTWWVGTSDARLRLLLASGAVGVLSLAWLIAEGLAGRLTWVVDFFETSNPAYRLFSTITPDYLDTSGATWALHALWIALAAGLVWWGYSSSPEAMPDPEAEQPSCVAPLGARVSEDAAAPKLGGAST